jgi:hypothetical protein
LSLARVGKDLEAERHQDEDPRGLVEAAEFWKIC